MNLQDRGDGVPDPLLMAAMDELRKETVCDVDWERLRSSINEGAALPLARRRAPRKSFVTRPLATVALAASVAFALWAGPGVYQDLFAPVPTQQYVTTVDEDVLMEALTGDLSEQELLRLVTGSPEVLLAVAIGPR